MNKTRFIFLLALWFLAAVTLNQCKGIKQDLENYLEAAHRDWGFEGAVLVAHDGRAVLAKGFGYANREFNVPNSSRTKFFIGSITKQFTASLILILEQDGLLRIEDPISKYLPDYPRETGDRILIHHLLTHTSGVPNYTDIPEILLRRTDVIPPRDIIELFKNRPLEFEPGSKYKYSNSGYIILGAIIEAVSGQSYEAFLHRRLLKPLDMLSSGYGRRVAGLPNLANGYTIEEDGVVIKAIPIETSILHTAGALYSTIDDMRRWDEALYTDKILNGVSIEKMLVPYAGDYGYGWTIDKRYGRRHAYHGGYATVTTALLNAGSMTELQ